MDLPAMQAALRELKFDAWLFYDHHRRDSIAYEVLGLPARLFASRRWYYVVPAHGEPQKLVHRIEAEQLDSLPGAKRQYAARREQAENLKQLLAPYRTVAMQYSHDDQIFSIGLVDAGTVDQVRSFGKTVVSSGDLVAQFAATLTQDQIQSHFAARDAIDAIIAAAFQEIGRRIRNGGTSEFEMQQWIDEALRREGLTNENDPPFVAVGANTANPHYGPSAESSSPIREADLVMLDVWAKKDAPDAVYYDVTWMGYVGASPSSRYQELFRTVCDARDAGVRKVVESVAAGRTLRGWEVDQAVREVIECAGYGRCFFHRTGHSITTQVHGSGTNMDNLESHDARRVLPNTCFSIEPGIYLPDFGVHSEVNMLVRRGSAEVTGRIQREIVRI